MHSASGPNPLDPNRMSAQERLDEVADLLARAIIRRHIRQIQTHCTASESAQETLAKGAQESVHGPETLSAEEAGR